MAHSDLLDAGRISHFDIDGQLPTLDEKGALAGDPIPPSDVNRYLTQNHAAGGFTGFANPTASVGLVAVNGVATTAMRSDGAPALDQGIVPTMTGLWTFNAGISVGGNIVVTGTVDGIDISVHAANVDAHHSEVHVVNSTGPHAEAGLTVGHMLRASGVAVFSFAAIQNADVPSALDVNPGTCTVATANVAATPHTHAITTSSNPGAAASVLASSAAGLLQLVGVGIGAAAVAGGIAVADGTWHGIGVAAERIVFDAAGYVSVMGADFGVGTLTPKPTVDVYQAGNLAAINATSDRTTGIVGGLIGYGLNSTPASTFFGGYYVSISSNIAAAEDGYLSLYTRNAGAWGERVRIDHRGYRGLGTISPDRLNHTEASTAETVAIAYANRLSHTTSGAAAPLFGVGQEHELEDAGGAMQVASETATLWATATAGAESPLYRGTTYPIGAAGPGYWGFWTWNNLDDNARTIVPNGAGDVASGVTIMYRLSESGGGAEGNVVMVANNASVDLYDDGVDVFTLTVNADGSVTVVRSAGATTAKLSLLMCWL